PLHDALPIYALVELDRKAVAESKPFAQRDQRAPGGIGRGVQGNALDATHRSAHRVHAHHRLFDDANRGDVARPVDDVPEQVEADADVADACGCERAGLAMVWAHVRIVPSRGLRFTTPRCAERRLWPFPGLHAPIPAEAGVPRPARRG